MKLKLADLIKTKRKSLNISQKKLAEGICTQTIISRLEKGEVTPSIDIFFKIIKKLNIPTSEIEALFDINTKDYQPSHFKVNKLIELLYKRDYKTLDFVLSSIDKSTLDSSMSYFEWFQAITAYHIKNQLDFAIKSLKTLIVKVEAGSILYCDICNTLGNFYSEKELFEDALLWYEKVLPYIKIIQNTSSEQSFYFSIARIYGILNKLNDATYWNSIAITKALENKSFYLLGDNYYLQARLFEEQKLIEDAINSCNKSISIFSLENNETMRSLTLSYLHYLKEKKHEEI